MCARKKQKRIEEAKNLSNIFDGWIEGSVEKMKNFIDKNPIVLELGCGSGDYTNNLAKLYPNKKFIGIDIQGERLWIGAKQALREKINNAGFLRISIEQLDKFFDKNSVEEIWITFPDPFPTKKQAKKRLTSVGFLKMYKKILKPNGLLRLKTDNACLFDYSLESIADFGGQIKFCTNNVDKTKRHELINIHTYFENKHRRLGTTIKYLEARL